MAYRLGRLRVDDPALGPIDVEGDGFAAAGELVTLVISEAVQKKLRLSPSEAAAAERISKEYRNRLNQIYAAGEHTSPNSDPDIRAVRSETEKRLAELLGPDRAQRLKEVSWRTRRGDALLDDEVAEALGLTSEQRAALARIADANEEENRRVISEINAVRLRNPGQLQQQAAKYIDAGSKRLHQVLTSEQREKFERLKESRS